MSEDSAPFEILRPRGRAFPVVVEVPHAGTEIPPAALARIVAPARALARDADLYVDRLFCDAPAAGATVIVARPSRYLVDLNRAADDIDAESVQGGPARPGGAPRGLVWRATTEGHRVLDRPLTREELEQRLAGVYRPYHAALRSLLEHARAAFGHAVLVCAHSMPSRGRRGHDDPGAERADLVPGTRGGTTAAPRFVAAIDTTASALGWSVQHDRPYRGGFTTGLWGRPEAGYHAIQIELARRLYMDEEALVPRPDGFRATAEGCRRIVHQLCEIT